MKKRETKVQLKHDGKMDKAVGRNPDQYSTSHLEEQKHGKTSKHSRPADDSWGEPSESASPKRVTGKLTFREKKSKEGKRDDELDQDFLSFGDVPENAFTVQEPAKPAKSNQL